MCLEFMIVCVLCVYLYLSGLLGNFGLIHWLHLTKCRGKAAGSLQTFVYCMLLLAFKLVSSQVM